MTGFMYAISSLGFSFRAALVASPVTVKKTCNVLFWSHFISLTVRSRHQANATNGASSLSLVSPSPAQNLVTKHEHELNKIHGLPRDDTQVSGSSRSKENFAFQNS
jgi:hypothetical protein